MNIRPANKFDLPYFIDLIHKINEQNELTENFNIKMELDDDYINTIFTSVIHGAGICYIAESDTYIGIIMGVISPNTWSPSTLMLHEMLYYVDPEYRFTKAGYLLFKEFNKKADELLKEKRIKHICITAPHTLVEKDFSKYGYRLSEKTWVRQEYYEFS
jgi:hypothetical protein